MKKQIITKAFVLLTSLLATSGSLKAANEELVHELLICNDRTLFEWRRGANRIATVISNKSCAQGTLTKFTQDEVSVHSTMDTWVVLRPNPTHTLPNLKLDDRLTLIVNFPRTVIEFPTREERDAFLARVKLRPGLRVKFFANADSRLSNSDFTDYLAFKARIVHSRKIEIFELTDDPTASHGTAPRAETPEPQEDSPKARSGE